MCSDNRGDVHEFKKLQEASNALLNQLEEIEKDKQYETQYIDAYIMKGPPGVGFGMIVVEDLKRGAVSVKVRRGSSIGRMNMTMMSEFDLSPVHASCVSRHIVTHFILEIILLLCITCLGVIYLFIFVECDADDATRPHSP